MPPRVTVLALMRVCRNSQVMRIESLRTSVAYAIRKSRGTPGSRPSPPQIASSSRMGGTGMPDTFPAMTVLPVVYLAAGEGRRLRPLTDAAPKAMLDVGGVSLAQRALSSLRAAGVEQVVAVTGHARAALEPLGDLITGERFNARWAEHNNIYSLWCARDVVAGGCYVVNCDVLFEDAVARALVGATGSAVLCASDHGVDAESMKAVAREGRLDEL